LSCVSADADVHNATDHKTATLAIVAIAPPKRLKCNLGSKISNSPLAITYMRRARASLKFPPSCRARVSARGVALPIRLDHHHRHVARIAKGCSPARSGVRAAPAARFAVPHGVIRTSTGPAPGVILIPACLVDDRRDGGGDQPSLTCAWCQGRRACRATPPGWKPLDR
jgi:hypothetical protein